MTPGAWLQTTAAAATSIWVLLRPRVLSRPLASRGPLRRLQRRDGLVLGVCLGALVAGLAVKASEYRDKGLSLPLHTWDVYHYYMGAKYFPELGYTGLYECAVVADIQDGHGEGLKLRNIRDLKTNKVQSALAVASDPDRCLRRFGAPRWQSFKRDIAWFRNRMTTREWIMAQTDHGFNGTPVWLLVGRPLASLGPASTAQMFGLMMVDVTLLCVMWLVLWRVFGWRAALVALVYWATNYTSRLAWTNGAYLRQGWLVLTMLGVSLLYRRRHAAAGFALTWAAGLRLFPAALLAGPVINALRRIWERRRPTLSAEHRRLVLGSLAALLLLGGLSLALHGPGAWAAFWRDITQHHQTPAINLIGLKALAAYNTHAKELIDHNRRDGLELWRKARKDTYLKRRPVFLVLVAAFILLLARAVWRRPDWESALLSMGLVAIAGQPANYYLSFFLGLGLFYDRYPWVAGAMCAYAAVGWLMVPLMPEKGPRYIWLSALTLVLVLGITYWFAANPPHRDDEGPGSESELQQ
jgi:hypothetical protein